MAFVDNTDITKKKDLFLGFTIIWNRSQNLHEYGPFQGKYWLLLLILKISFICLFVYYLEENPKCENAKIRKQSYLAPCLQQDVDK